VGRARLTRRWALLSATRSRTQVFCEAAEVSAGSALRQSLLRLADSGTQHGRASAVSPAYLDPVAWPVRSRYAPPSPNWSTWVGCSLCNRPRAPNN
jgi:hypothetical protein